METTPVIRTVKADVVIEDGAHKGKITAIEIRTEPYAYVDVVLEFEDGKKLTAGYPDFLAPSSKLGQFLLRFGMDLQIGSAINFDFLINRTCQFITLTKKGKNGKEYANVVADSVKPIEKE